MIKNRLHYYYQHQTTEIVMEIKVGTIVRLKEQNIFGIVKETKPSIFIVDWFETVFGQKMWLYSEDTWKEKLEIICK